MTWLDLTGQQVKNVEFTKEISPNKLFFSLESEGLFTCYVEIIECNLNLTR